MGADVAGIGRRNDWPCVGDPDGVMFACASEGVVSLLALVPVGSVAHPGIDQSDESPVVVHVTACRTHSLRVRRWLRERMRPDDQVDVYGTDYLMARWGMVQEEIGDVPILRMAHAG